MNQSKAAVLAVFMSLAVPATAAADANSDFQRLFASTDNPAQIQVLTDQEMAETEGAWVVQAAGAASGTVIGLYTYGGYLAGGGTYTHSGAFMTVGGAALGGMIAGPGTVHRMISLTRAGAFTGYVAGRMEYHGL